MLGAGGQAQHVGVLGRHHEEGRAEQRVRTGREDGVVDAHLRVGERDLGALGAADPVALHRDHVLRPVDRREIVEQAVGVVGDAEEPLLELAQLDGGAAALAGAVDDLLVGQHGGVLGTPVDRGLLAVGQPALEELQEDPLGPAVVARLVGAELTRPVDRDAPGAELALEGLDRGLGGDARVHAGLDRVVLGRQAEGVVAHRVQDAHAVATAEMRDRVSDRVVLQMPHVGLARRVREHLEHIGARRAVVLVGDFPGALAFPDRLPLAFDLVRLVTMLGHWARRLASSARNPRCRTNSPRNSVTDGLNCGEYRLGAIAQLGERVAGSHEVGGSSPPGSTNRKGRPNRAALSRSGALSRLFDDALGGFAPELLEPVELARVGREDVDDRRPSSP